MLYTCGISDKHLVSQVTGTLKRVFHKNVDVKDLHLDLITYYDPTRRQYNGDLLLKKMEDLQNDHTTKAVGLFKVDLFIPILTYIFGQAYLNGNAAIASTYRLHNERYGLNSDHALLTDRFKKEVVHELGHTYGLIHCHTPGCVMQSSTYVEDIDQKSFHLCKACRGLL